MLDCLSAFDRFDSLAGKRTASTLLFAAFVLLRPLTEPAPLPYLGGRGSSFWAPELRKLDLLDELATDRFVLRFDCVVDIAMELRYCCAALVLAAFYCAGVKFCKERRLDDLVSMSD